MCCLSLCFGEDHTKYEIYSRFIPAFLLFELMCHKNPLREDREGFIVYVPNHRSATAKLFAYRTLTKKWGFFLIIYNRARVQNVMFYQKEVIMTSLFKLEKNKTSSSDFSNLSDD